MLHMKSPKFPISTREKEIIQIFGLAYVFTLIVIGIVYYEFHVDTLNPSPDVDVTWV